MSKSNYLSKAFLDHTLGGQTFNPPSNVYIGLFISEPGDGTGGTEASGASYARAEIANNDTNFPAATGTTAASKANGVTITFPTAGSGGWSSGATMTHWVMFDGATGDNRLYHGSLTVPKPVLEGDEPIIPPGSLVITED